MIKYPVKVIENPNTLTRDVEVLDSTGMDIITCDTLEIARDVANALNAIHELEGKPMSCLWSYNITDWWNKYIHKNTHT